MAEIKSSFLTRHWVFVILAAFAAGGAVTRLVTLSEHRAEGAPSASPATTEPESVVEPVADDPSPPLPPEPEATWRSDAEIANGPPPGHPFAVGLAHAAFYEVRGGRCVVLFGNTANELAANLEGDIGIRYQHFDWFKDGIIVDLKDGRRVPVWSRKIDCLDPPYQPLGESPVQK